MVDLSEAVGELSAVGQLLVSIGFLYVFLKVIGLVANALEAAPIGFSTPLDDVSETVTSPVDDGLAWTGDQLGGFD
jgi:hypothetical protein